MNRISVILLQYSSSFAGIQQTLRSVTERVANLEKVYLISTDVRQGEIFTVKHKFGFDLVHLPVRNRDMGAVINKLIPSLTTEYVMFLYANDMLVNQIGDFTAHLNEHQSVLSLPPDSQGISCHRPFLVKTTRLRQGPLFYQADQVPFPEAILPAWLAQLDRSEVVDLPESIIRPARQNLRSNDRYIHEALASFQPKSTDSGDRLSPSIDVIVATYNMGRYLETALASLVTQNQPPDQILVIDDGSTDDTQERLKKWIKNTNLTVVHIENVGKSKALNLLLPFVKSDFVLELDADDWLDPNALSVIRKHLRDLPAETNLLYGNLRMWKQHTSGLLLCRGVRQGKSISHADELLRIQLPLGPRIYRTAVLLEFGGFPVVHFADGRLYEDVLMVRKLMERSPILYQDFTVYNVREHPTSITKRNLSKWKEFQNQWDQHLIE